MLTTIGVRSHSLTIHLVHNTEVVCFHQRKGELDEKSEKRRIKKLEEREKKETRVVLQN